MTSPRLEQRLRRAMGPNSAPSSLLGDSDDVTTEARRQRGPGQPGWEQRGWAEVQRRIEAERRNHHRPAHQHRGTPDRRLPGVRVLTGIAAGTFLVVAARVVWPPSEATSTGGVGSPIDGPVGLNLPSVPSSWWLVVATITAAAVTVVIGRSLRQPLLTTAAALIATGVLGGLALMLPSMRAGQVLAADAPTLPGYELAAARIDYWPDLHSREATVLRYSPADGSATAGDGLDAVAERLGMTDPLPTRSGYSPIERCLPRPGGPEGEFLRAEMYCLASIDDGDLIVSGHISILGNRLLLPRLVSYGLFGFGLIFLLVAVAGGRLGEGPLWPGLGAVATALCIFSVAGYLIGSIAYDLLRVRLAVDIPAECRPGAGTGIVECRNIVYPALDAGGALHSGQRIYWPLYVIADMAAMFLVAVGWVVGLVGGMNQRRWLLFGGLTVVVLLVGATSQLGSADLIDTMSNLND